MRAEGVYRLAGKIITFKERIHRHRHRAPIVGVAEVNLVVGVQIFRQVQNLRARLFLQVGLRLGNAGLVVFGVRPRLLYLEKLAAGQPRKYFRRLFGVAGGAPRRLPQ